MKQTFIYQFYLLKVFTNSVQQMLNYADDWLNFTERTNIIDILKLEWECLYIKGNVHHKQGVNLN